MQKILLDTREMEHPEPLRLSLKALLSMDEASYFYMIHRKNPVPLIEIAKEKGFPYLVHEDTQGVWHILISKNTVVNLEEYLDV